MHFGRRAVVIGAGIGGLTAAQALVGRFEEVIVLEWDLLPDGINSRVGVPQGLHPHVLLPGGARALVDLFADFATLMRDSGAKAVDFGAGIRMEFPGQDALPRRQFDIDLFICTRPLLEAVIRRCVLANKDLTILAGRRVTQIVPTPDGNAVAAVKCEVQDGTVETYETTLVVDASSRGELTLDFLRATARPAPAETRIGVDFKYSTAIVEFPVGAAPSELAMFTMPNAPATARAGILLAREDNNFFIALGGRGADAPPIDWHGFVDFAAMLPSNTLYRELGKAKLHGKINRFAFPASRRRHYEQTTNWPHGLVPISDAVCRFNPLYGQGMTSAAMQAVVLRDLLARRQGQADPLAGLAPALMDGIAPMLDNFWGLSKSHDLADPDARVERPQDLEQALEYERLVARAAVLDRDIHKLLFEVIALIRPAAALHVEAIVEKVKRIAAELPVGCAP